jgi:hypothetical protein
LPRKTIPADLGLLARSHTERGVKVLAGIASAEDAPPAARVAAVTGCSTVVVLTNAPLHPDTGSARIS